MPEKYQETRLWQTALAAQTVPDVYQLERERLRSSFINFRTRVALLASEIHRSLPDFTVHDITHLDALWEIAELAVGSAFELTPTEAYVLGGAFLLHDLGMGLASYPGGLSDLKRERSWPDLAVKEFTSRFNRQPTQSELEALPRDVQDQVVANLLRLLHAKHAETLATVSWRLSDSDNPQFLIEDTELRQAFGRTIGRVAHSHWWPIHRLDNEFTRTLGAPYWCPREWTVDPLKLACLLRVADAAHIDARRAPPFLRRIRRPEWHSDEHWLFQEKLQKPQTIDDALVFTSGHAFTFSEAPAWWLCLDTLSMINDELRSVDALLADRKLARLMARRVAGVDSPERMVAYIPTDGWLPVNASLQVSDLPRVIETLGGAELYGRDLRIPLRELIQNAADAIRARRSVDGRSSEWGTITVALGRDGENEWLEVRDTGLGMSREVLTRYLLDFGTTYWASALMMSEFPGLLTSGFQATGKYGIGFFSTFMLGERVSVTTRRFDAAQADTLILEFSSGVSGRPILRPAREEERLRDGGTTVRVWLRRPSAHLNGLLGRRRDGPAQSLRHVCMEVAPSLDVHLAADEFGTLVPVIAANDWTSISAIDLIRRTHDWEGSSDRSFDDVEASAEIAGLAQNLRSIEVGGEVYGRVAIVPEWHRIHGVTLHGVVTVGGLAATSLRSMLGVLTGSSRRAARDVGRPLVPYSALAAWASERAKAAIEVFDDAQMLDVASTVWACGGDTGALPVAITARGHRTWNEIVAEFENGEEVLLASSYRGVQIRELVPNASFVDNVIFIETSVHMGLNTILGSEWWPIDAHPRWEGFEHGWRMASMTGAVIAALSLAWAIPIAELADSKRGHSNRDERVVARAGDREFVYSVEVISRIPRPNEAASNEDGSG